MDLIPELASIPVSINRDGVVHPDERMVEQYVQAWDCLIASQKRVPVERAQLVSEVRDLFAEEINRRLGIKYS